MSREIAHKPSRCDGEDNVEHAVDWVNRISLRPYVDPSASKPRLFPHERNTGRASAPAQVRNGWPGRSASLSLDHHRMGNRNSVAGRLNERLRLGVWECASPGRFGNLRLDDPLGEPYRISQDLGPQNGGAGLRRWRHDGEEIAHPIERHQRDAMRGAEPNSFDGDEAAPTGHDDGGRMLSASGIFETSLTIEDNQRAASDAKAGVVGACRYDLRFDLEAFAPIDGRGGLLADWWRRRGFGGAKQYLPRAPRIRSGRLAGVGFVSPARRRRAVRNRRPDDAYVKWVASCSHPATLRWVVRRVTLDLWISNWGLNCGG